MELHCLQNCVSLLILGHSEVQCGLLLVRLSHFTDVADLVERHDGVPEEKPSQSSGWLREELAEIEQALGTWARHQVNEDERQRGALHQEVVGILGS